MSSHYDQNESICLFVFLYFCFLFQISFGVVDSTGAPASYAEGCSSVLAAVSGGDSMIVSIKLPKRKTYFEFSKQLDWNPNAP